MAVNWYFEKKDLKNTPSFLHGIDPDLEYKFRKAGAEFLYTTGTKLGLHFATVATGAVYYHRFYMFHSFRDFPKYLTACCCLFLAGKVEETPKKCKDVIKIARTVLTDEQFVEFGEDAKEELLTLERILLQTIKFDLQVEHPYAFLLSNGKNMKGDKTKIQNVVQMAWTFANDSLRTTLCLQWEPEVIAIALIYLACKLTKFDITDWNQRQPHHKKWWDVYVEDMTVELLEDICHQVLDLYSENSTMAAASPRGSSPKSRNMLPVSYSPRSAAGQAMTAQTMVMLPSGQPLQTTVLIVPQGQSVTMNNHVGVRMNSNPSSPGKIPSLLDVNVQPQTYINNSIPPLIPSASVNSIPHGAPAQAFHSGQQMALQNHRPPSAVIGAFPTGQQPPLQHFTVPPPQGAVQVAYYPVSVGNSNPPGMEMYPRPVMGANHQFNTSVPPPSMNHTSHDGPNNFRC